MTLDIPNNTEDTALLRRPCPGVLKSPPVEITKNVFWWKTINSHGAKTLEVNNKNLGIRLIRGRNDIADEQSEVNDMVKWIENYYLQNVKLRAAEL